MTDDDVVEAMARAAAEADMWPGVWEGTQTRGPMPEILRGYWRNIARAAIRALHERGGLVLREVPGDAVCTEDAGDQEWAWVNGCNHGYASVRAAAVKMEGV